MAFGRSAARDDRRRRVLNEDRIGSTAVPQERPAPASNRRGAKSRVRSARYTDAAAYDSQPRLTDLVPQRLAAQLALLLAVAALMAGLVAIDRHEPRLARMLGTERFEPLRLDSFGSSSSQATGSLGAWLASTTLLWVGFLCWVVYTLRRHRIDDYQGRYRIWLWALLASLGLSLSTSVPIEPLLMGMVQSLTGWDSTLAALVGWQVPLVVAWFVLAGRLLIEVAECRSALFALAAAQGLWSVALLSAWQILPIASPGTASLATVAADLLLIVALTRYAAHAAREAQGLAPPQQKRKGRHTARAAEKPAAATSNSTDAAQSAGPQSPGSLPAEPAQSRSEKQPLVRLARGLGGTPATAAAERRAAGRPVSAEGPPGNDPCHQASEDDAEEDDAGDMRRMHKLSKAERKRLRKNKQRLRRAA